MLQSYTFSLILPLFIVKKSYKLTKNGVMQSIMTPFPVLDGLSISVQNFIIVSN